MELVLVVEANGVRGALGAGPKGRARGRELVLWEVVEQLRDGVVEAFAELEPRPDDAVLKRRGPRVDEGDLDAAQRLQALRRLRVEALRERGGGNAARTEIRVGVVDALLERPFEPVARPLQRVLDAVREVLQRADGDALLGRVARRAVRLRHAWRDDLRVALGAQRARLEHGLAVEDALAVDVEPCVDVVQRRAHAVELCVEPVVEDAVRLRADAQLQALDGHAAVDVLGSRNGANRLGLADVRGAEQELPRQIRFFDVIHVRHDNCAAVRFKAHAHQGPVLEHLAADGARPDEEVLEAMQLVDDALADDAAQRVVAVAAGQPVQARTAVEELARVKVEPLRDGRKLGRARLEHLLADDAAER
mmetsp:Transcript_18079/g.60999  ORF Transcript_18079/g.60999 Transcript_18079/m.60999 type:complete len:364 (+) Transcript_18079:1362-2453(+)